MSKHRFESGQTVEVMRHTLGGNEAGMYHVVRTLPPNGVENQYRLKSQKDGHERVVLESRMRSGAAI